MSARGVDVAIVGGGSVGVSFLYQLIDALPRTQGCSIALFEPDPDIGPGTAYQADANSNLLNIPVNRMSAIAQQPDSFLQWLRQRDAGFLERMGITEIDPGSFVSRPVFGLYMQDIYDRALTLAGARGIKVRHYRQCVVKIQPRAHGGAVVQGADGMQIEAARVVLCNGNLPSVAFAELSDSPRYFNSPYPVADMTRTVGETDDVCIVGTSLSAIDAIVALHAAGHRGVIHCVSRNGRLPAVRSPHNKGVRLPRLPEVEPDGRVTLDGLVGSLRRALQEAGGVEDPHDILGSGASAAEALEEEIARSQAGPRLWQSVAAATNERIEHIWHALDETERLRFHRDWRTLWMARRATFPMRNALTLQTLLRANRLRVYGGFQGVTRMGEGEGFEVVASTKLVRAPWLINATSFSLDVGGTSDPLVRDLCDAGHARAHPLGGFDLDFDTGCLIDANGMRADAISVLGSLAAGTYFWTTSMEINARLAHGQARQVAEQVMAQADRVWPDKGSY